MRSRALNSPFGGAPRRGRAPASISVRSCRSDFSLDKVTDLYVTFKCLTGKLLYWRMPMRAIEAETFSGYGGLKQTELPKPLPAKDRVLVRVTAAGVTTLDHTILSGGHPRAKAPLVLGNEGAGVVEDAGDSGLAAGSRVMFTGPYGVRENGAWQEWLLARPEDMAIVPDAIDDVVAASLPVAYLAAQITLTLAGFKPGKTVLAPAIGGSVGNATYQLARAQGAGKVISTAGSATKAAKARKLGFENVIDLSAEGLADEIG